MEPALLEDMNDLGKGLTPMELTGVSLGSMAF